MNDYAKQLVKEYDAPRGGFLSGPEVHNFAAWIVQRRTAALTVTPTDWAASDMLEAAWGLIANASGGDWTKESPEWQAAAAKWRDAYVAPS